ncbi:hypothetical protein GCM10022256_19550 [Frondihabitans peucedani]|uniref:Uncharacterized protein n=1 Tax=Frondihabitans peucedani TaxID=598626 RepID=A0ABP8E2A9_9MICO
MTTRSLDPATALDAVGRIEEERRHTSHTRHRNPLGRTASGRGSYKAPSGGEIRVKSGRVPLNADA